MTSSFAFAPFAVEGLLTVLNRSCLQFSAEFPRGTVSAARADDLLYSMSVGAASLKCSTNLDLIWR
jgi:hypothetical protein